MRVRTNILVWLALLLWATPLWAGQTHTVEPGDRLGGIAARYGVSVEQLREWNSLDSDVIRVGQTLVVSERAAPRRTPEVVHVEVRPGDILGTIAQRHGVTVADIRRWNNLRSDNIFPGQRLELRPAEAAAQRALREQGMIEVEVRPGDILGAIAERHEVTVAQIRAWNNMTSDTIFPGQRLRVQPGARHQAASARPASAQPTSTAAGQTHTIVRGDTLIGIAQRYGVTVDMIREWNPRVNADRLQIGQTLVIGSARGRMVRRVTYEVQPGDFLERIARRHGVTIPDIVRWNRGLNPDRLQIGQRLILMLEGPEDPSESVGQAFDGRLVNGEQLPPHRGFVIRDARRAWGTNFTITAILDAFEYVQTRFPNAPRLRVHDLSYEHGGPIARHRSHQSGRDVDIGYFYRGCRGTCEYRVVRPSELDVELQWALMHFWIRNDLVDYMFVDYSLQRRLYEWLQGRGATQAQLSTWFQYPHGRGAARGIIRHEPGHANHIHVRFACDRRDDRCR